MKLIVAILGLFLLVGCSKPGEQFIGKWSNEVNEKYQPKADITNVADAEGKTIVTAQVSGTFPGSPVQIRYNFTLQGDKIATLKIEA